MHPYNAIFRESVLEQFAPLIDEYGFQGPVEMEGGGIDVLFSYYSRSLVVSIYIDRDGMSIVLSFSRNTPSDSNDIEYQPELCTYLEISDVLFLIGADGRIAERQRVYQHNIHSVVAWCFKQTQIVLPIMMEYYSEILKKVGASRNAGEL